MNHTIVVLKGIHSYDKSAYYEAYCNRCHESVVGRNRMMNRSWSTKSVAVKHAQEHAEMHAKADSNQWRYGAAWGEVVATIPVNCGSEETHVVS